MLVGLQFTRFPLQGLRGCRQRNTLKLALICRRVSSKTFLHGNFLVRSKLCIGWWPLGGPSWALRGNDLGLTNGHSLGGHDPGVTNGHYLGGLIQVWPMAIIWVAWSKVWPMVIMWCNWDLGEILQHHWKLCRLSSRPHDVLSMCCGSIHLKESTLRSLGLEAGSLFQVTLLREEHLSKST